MVTRFMCWPAMAARCLPTGTEPVKEIFLMAGCGMSACDTSAGTPYRRLTTPLGIPASTKHATSAAVQFGASSGGLITIVHPAASAAPTFRATCVSGKFHGAKAATGPTGS